MPLRTCASASARRKMSIIPSWRTIATWCGEMTTCSAFLPVRRSSPATSERAFARVSAWLAAREVTFRPAMRARSCPAPTKRILAAGMRCWGEVVTTGRAVATAPACWACAKPGKVMIDARDTAARRCMSWRACMGCAPVGRPFTSRFPAPQQSVRGLKTTFDDNAYLRERLSYAH